MSIRNKLTMTCTITPVTGQDTAGVPTYGSPVTEVKCFAFGNTNRVRSTNGEEKIPRFQILLLASADIGINYKVADVLTKRSTLVLKSGIVVGVEDNFHPTKDLVLRQAYVELT